MKKRAILIGVVGALLLIVVLVVVGRNVKDRQANTLVLKEEYVRPYAYGFDGFGILEPDMDRMQLYEDVMKIYEAYPDSERTENYLGSLNKLFEFKMDKSTDLSNGDIVEIEVIPDELAFKEMGIYIESKKFSFEIKGLKSVEDFNLFETANLYKINYESGTKYRMDFYGDETLLVSEDDLLYTLSLDRTTITVKIKDDVVDELEEKGIYPKEIEREFLIENIEYLYATSYKEMPTDAYNSFRYGGDNVVELVYREFSNVLKIESIDYYGGWITTYDDADYINRVVGIYELKASTNEENTITMYVCCEKYDFIADIYKVKYKGAEFLLNLENRCTVVIDKKNYKLYGSDKLSDLFEKGEYLTVDFDPNGNISGFEGLK